MTLPLCPLRSVTHDGDPTELREEVSAWAPEHASDLAFNLARRGSPCHHPRDGARRHVTAPSDIGQAEASQDEFGPNRASLLRWSMSQHDVVIDITKVNSLVKYKNN